MFNRLVDRATRSIRLPDGRHTTRAFLDSRVDLRSSVTLGHANVYVTAQICGHAQGHAVQPRSTLLTSPYRSDLNHGYSRASRFYCVRER